jgi:hypothetical protein
MTSFHFNYKFHSYTAQVNINELNGNMSCELLGVLSDETNQSVSLNDFESADSKKDKNELTEAIKRGLSKYLDNFPVDHCKSVHDYF